ncbi:MAG: methyltransferase domain-containing protein [archaeon]|nr:methyltransferase domain-containing protein [archaeon]
MPELNTQELELKVKDMYTKVAQKPFEKYHFEMGRNLAEKLGYSLNDLNAIPKESMDSFAGVGYHFDFAKIMLGETILDLGSGSGMDAFIAALFAGKNGKVLGVDMTDAQLEKAGMLAKIANFSNMEFVKSYIESLPFEEKSFDVIISNGVINLSSQKAKVFREIARVLKKNGRMAISDIVSEKPLTEGIKCDATIWASCIGGAAQEDEYKAMIENAGMKIISIKTNSQYGFISKSAQGAAKDFGVKSISVLAIKK